MQYLRPPSPFLMSQTCLCDSFQSPGHYATWQIHYSFFEPLRIAQAATTTALVHSQMVHQSPDWPRHYPFLVRTFQQLVSMDFVLTDNGVQPVVRTTVYRLFHELQICTSEESFIGLRQ